MSDSLRNVLETFGIAPATIVRAEWLRDEFNDIFQADVTDELTAGLVGEYEPMGTWGVTITAADIPVGTMRDQVYARLERYGSKYLDLVAGQCWCGRFHMDALTDAGHELLTALRIPALADWLNRKLGADS